MDGFRSIPQNITCESYFSSQMGLMGFALFYAVSRCSEIRKSDSMGGDGARGVDSFITHTANKYFSGAPQITLLYDESWEISEMLIKLESETRKAFVCYYIPRDKNVRLGIKTKPAIHISHRSLPKATAVIAFVKDEKGFENLLNLSSEFPWWNARARMIILVKEKSLSPTKGILAILNARKMYNALVVTETAFRGGKTSGDLLQVFTEEGDSPNEAGGAAIQIAALNPFPPPGQPRELFIAKWEGGKFKEQIRPLFLDKMEQLHGHKLRACVFEFPPLVMWMEIKPRKFGYGGLEVRIFEELSTYMNFTREIYEVRGAERWGTDMGDGEWNGVIGEVSKGKADIGFANIPFVEGREKAVDITVPYDQDRGCFAVPRPEAMQNWLGLILPFSWQVWACTLSLAFIAGPLFSLVTRPLHLDKSMSIGRGIFYALGAIMSVQKKPRANSSALRAFIIAWLIFCWMIAILYRVALIVSLTAVPSSYKIDTVGQLAKSGLRWGGFEEKLQTFANTTDKTDRLLVKHFQPIEDVWRGLDRVASKGDFAVMDSSKLLHYAAKGIYFNGYRSAFHITKECPTYYNVGFALPHGSSLLDRINELVHLMQNAGLIKHWLDEIQYQAVLKTPNKIRGSRKDYGLTLDHLKLLFVIMLYGYFSGFVAFVVENCIAWRGRKRTHMEKLLQRREDRAERRRKRDRLTKISRKQSAISVSDSICTFTSDEYTASPSITVTESDIEKEN